jgi:hypothetical protein
MEHWRLMTRLLELLPRDWHPYGLLDRWGGGYHGNPATALPAASTAGRYVAIWAGGVGGGHATSAWI